MEHKSNDWHPNKRKGGDLTHKETHTGRGRGVMEAEIGALQL